MELQFILERVHRRSLFSARAYQILFTDTDIYFVHLGEDAAQVPVGQAVGGFLGAVAQSIVEKQSEKGIARKLEELDRDGLDKVVARDTRSFKAAYAHLDGFSSAPYKWNQWPQVVFKIRGKGSFKFTFDLQMEDLEDERQAFVEFMRGKRPDLFSGPGK